MSYAGLALRFLLWDLIANHWSLDNKTGRSYGHNI
jgi:hypothetical protein